jgi:hypothetical protein
MRAAKLSLPRRCDRTSSDVERPGTSTESVWSSALDGGVLWLSAAELATGTLPRAVRGPGCQKKARQQRVNTHKTRK